MSNHWIYTSVFDQKRPIAELLDTVRQVADRFGSTGWSVCSGGPVGGMDATGDWRAFGSINEAIRGMADAGGGLITFRDEEDDYIDLVFEVAPARVRLLSGGALREGDDAYEAKLRSGFLWMCENLHPLFGSSEDLQAVEHLWAQFGVGLSGPDLDSVGRREQEDIQAGRMPEALPWLTYVDRVHFAEAAAVLPRSWAPRWSRSARRDFCFDLPSTRGHLGSR